MIILRNIFAFDEGRTLPNLLGCLLSRRFPVHASESWPVFFRSMVHLFGAILNDVTISLRKAFCLVLRCLSDVLEGSSFIAVWSVSYFVMLLKNFVGVIYQSLRKVCATSGPCTSTRTCFVLNSSRCLIELTRCGRKSNRQVLLLGHCANRPVAVAKEINQVVLLGGHCANRLVAVAVMPLGGHCVVVSKETNWVVVLVGH